MYVWKEQSDFVTISSETRDSFKHEKRRPYYKVYMIQKLFTNILLTYLLTRYSSWPDSFVPPIHIVENGGGVVLIQLQNRDGDWSWRSNKYSEESESYTRINILYYYRPVLSIWTIFLITHVSNSFTGRITDTHTSTEKYII